MSIYTAAKEAKSLVYANDFASFAVYLNSKAELARLLGLRGLSLWRLGTIPTDSSTGLNIWGTVTNAVQ